MKTQRALRHHRYGKLAEALVLEDIPIPEPGSGEVLVRLEAAAIHPSDHGMAEGSYGRLRDLPAVAGREGVGVVEALGPKVAGVTAGDRVRFPGEDGAWQEFAIARADKLLRAPAETPIEQAAISFINPPTAYCLLREMIDLRPGDWLVQNAGNSAVGVSVVQMAKAMGVRTISQVRRENLVEPLRAMGADQVVLEGSGWAKQAQELTDGAPVRLALNSIGGKSAIDQIKALGAGGTQVTFGGMVGDLVRFPTRFLIFNDVRLVGFWWDQWARRSGPAAAQEIQDAIYAMIREGRLELPIEAVYPFDKYAEALAHDKRPRFGKVLLKPRDRAL